VTGGLVGAFDAGLLEAGLTSPSPATAVTVVTSASAKSSSRRTISVTVIRSGDRANIFRVARHRVGQSALRVMAKPSHATWGGRFSTGPAELMLQFSESVSFDCRLAPFDIAGSKAHAAMLAHVGLISPAERDAIHGGLTAILAEVESGKFKWDTKLEDVHMNIEQALTKRVPAAAKLHTARSRNDQVATDMRLFFKYACAVVGGKIRGAQQALLTAAETNRDVLIPGYTHLQRAQPVYLAHHLFAWLEMLERDRARFADVAGHANWCPLGSGAIAGTTLPIDREFTAKALGFVDAKGRPQVTQNSMDTVADRDVFIEFAHACALFGVHLSRIAEDLILWSSTEFKFIDLPDAFCTGSSLMPQKKNPDSCELLRGKSARLQGNLHTLLTLTKGLPLTYNRDLQEDKPPAFDSFDQASLCADVLAGTLAGMQVNRERCAAAVRDPALLATDLADYLVLKGVPFRDAHHAVGAVVRLAEKNAVEINQLSTEDVQSVHSAFGADWIEVFDLKRALAKRTGTGMPGPKQVTKQFARWRFLLGKNLES
jgi:argininosuccinate lyase